MFVITIFSRLGLELTRTFEVWLKSLPDMYKALETIFRSGKNSILQTTHTNKALEKKTHILRQHEFINVHLKLCISLSVCGLGSFHLRDDK